MNEIYVYDPKYTIEIDWPGHSVGSPNPAIDRMGFVIKYGIDVVWKEDNHAGMESILAAITKAVNQLLEG